MSAAQTLDPRALPHAAPASRLLKFLGTADDPWQRVADDAAEDEVVFKPLPYGLLGWAHWLDVRERWPANMPVGVSLPNDLNVADVLADLPRLSLIELNYPKWTDGRAYSQARLLRVRHRYAGELRATGQVIADMAAQLYRTGFDSVRLRDGESAEVAQRMLHRFAQFYQADAHEPQVRFARATPGALPA